VEAQQEDLQAADDHVLVVARVADQRDPLGVARHVFDAVDVGREEHARRVFLVVLERLVDRAGSVEAVEVVARCPEVDQRVRVVPHPQSRGCVEGDVVVHELAEVGVRRWDIRVVTRRVGAARPVPATGGALFAHRLGELLQPIEWILGRRRQLAEHASEPAFVQQRPGNACLAPRGHAVHARSVRCHATNLRGCS